MRRFACLAFGLGLVLWLALAVCAAPGAEHEAPSAGPEAALRQSAAAEALARGQRFWQRIAQSEPPAATNSRSLLAYALTLCQSGLHPERLERLFDLAAAMQDRDPRSPNWGNLKWYWRDPGVTDTNAVEFCMQDAATLWIDHREGMPAGARGRLDELLRLGIEGCLRHRVPTDYTNMAILNAGNLIVLGERLDRPDAAAEGRRRLDALCLWTAAFGIHEFCSPTYYGTDLVGLLFLRTNARRQPERDQAAALLELFWTDVALNWFPPAERLAGCHSRSSDYLHGLGGLDWHLWIQGWLTSKSPGQAERLEPYGPEWSPPARLRQLSERIPRLVREHWGILPAECRTHMLYPDVTLSCCGAGYGEQDVPLAVDLPGSREQPRCYFIADGREDPYGKAPYDTGAAKHRKALHLTPFWAGAQRTCDAIGLALYRNKDWSALQVFHLQSHFVLRRGDCVWLGDDRLPAAALPSPPSAFRLPPSAPPSPLSAFRPPPSPLPLPPSAFRLSTPLVIRYGTAAVGVRLLWARTADGKAAPATLVDDDPTAGWVRLSVDHGFCPRPEKPPGTPAAAGIEKSGSAAAAPGPVPAAGAAFWVRVGTGLATQRDFDAWRTRFQAARPRTVQVAAAQTCIEVPGQDGPLRITVEPPLDRGGRVRICPEPCRGPIELDSQEIGRPLLAAVEPLRSAPPGANPLEPIRVPVDKPVSCPAASGLVLPGMATFADPAAPAGRYVCQPAGPIAGPNGSVSWLLEVQRAGRYWLWARLRSPDREPHSFYVSLLDSEGWLGASRIWQLPPHSGWQWEPLRPRDSQDPVALDLPAGPCRLHLRTRQPGAALDRLMLTPNASDVP